MKSESVAGRHIAPKLNRQLDKHFLACAAAAGAVCLAGSQQANADIVYSGTQNVQIFPLSVNGGVYIDVEPPFGSEQGNRPAGWDLNPYSSGQALYMNANGKFVMNGTSVAKLAPGTIIGPASNFSGANAAAGMELGAGQTGYIGFAFDPDNVAGSQTYYGWARFSVGDNASTNGSVVDWAYDTTGAAIPAGSVPEPTSLGLLAMGTVGLLTLRRRTANK